MKQIITTIIILTVIFAKIVLTWSGTDEQEKQWSFDDAQIAYKMVLNKEATYCRLLN